MAYIEETYTSEYVLAYEQVLAQSMVSLSTGKDTPVEKLFRLIDEASTDTTAIERLSMKKDTYMQIIQSVTAASQTTAMALVDKKYKMQHEIEVLKNQASEMLLNGTKDRELADDKIATGAAQRTSIAAQTALYDRQTEGFDDNKNQKLFESQLNSWALMYSSGLLTEMPSIIANDEVSSLYTTLKNS